MIITVTWLTVALVALVMYLRQVYSKLSDVGVNHLPVVPIFGNVFKTFFKLENSTKSTMTLMNAFPNDKIVGMYQFLSTFYIINDLETMKKICIKDFDHFVDRLNFINRHDPLFGRGLINLEGDEWREMRSTLSPAFTSSKMRLMVPFMVEVGEEMMKVLKERINNSGNKYVDLDLKDVTTRYANDVLASCAFGLKVNSQGSNNEFYRNSKEVTNFSLFQIMKIFFYLTFPSLATMLNIKVSAPENSEFFKNVVLSTMADREKHKITRNDMINILNQVKKGSLTHEKAPDTEDAGFATVEESAVGKKTYTREWTDDELVAQAVLFLFAGFETVSTTMTFILYELANNPDVQKRLVEEIREQDAKNGGKFDFNSIQSMEYMDMVVSEGLRLHPAAPLLNRKCIKDYNVGKINDSGKDHIIRKGDVVSLAFWNFHRKPELFPNPDKFDPERFSEENKHKIQPHSYMPFGMGPRNCIGSRFALCEIKVMLYQFLRDIEVLPCAKTVYPIVLDEGFFINVKNGAWLRLQHRK